MSVIVNVEARWNKKKTKLTIYSLQPDEQNNFGLVSCSSSNWMFDICVVGASLYPLCALIPPCFILSMWTL